MTVVDKLQKLQLRRLSKNKMY